MTTDNKFQVGGRLGDEAPYGPVGDDDLGAAGDFGEDSAGLPSSDIQNTKTDMDLALEPNRFPRQTGHDTLTGEEVIFS